MKKILIICILIFICSLAEAQFSIPQPDYSWYADTPVTVSSWTMTEIFPYDYWRNHGDWINDTGQGIHFSTYTVLVSSFGTVVASSTSTLILNHVRSKSAWPNGMWRELTSIASLYGCLGDGVSAVQLKRYIGRRR